MVHDLLKLYHGIDIPPERLLFKIPSTWQGIEASRVLESEGIQTHLTFVYSFGQAAAAAQAGASVIQIFVGRIRDWARNHSGDPEIEAALRREKDPGSTMVLGIKTGRRKRATSGNVLSTSEACAQEIGTPMTFSDETQPPDDTQTMVEETQPGGVGPTLGKGVQKKIARKKGEKLHVYVNRVLNAITGRNATPAATNELGLQIRRLCPLQSVKSRRKIDQRQVCYRR
ncbi:unnamed protein product [Camellia sinensis]